MYNLKTGNSRSDIHVRRGNLLVIYPSLTVIIVTTLILLLLPLTLRQATASSSSLSNSCNPGLKYPSPVSPYNETLSIRGTIDLSNSSVKLKPFIIFPGAQYTPRPDISRYSITLLDSSQRILAHYPFEPKVSTVGLMGKVNNKTALISEAVHYEPCTKKIVLYEDNKELVSRTVSDNTPEVYGISISETGKNNTSSDYVFSRGKNITVKWDAVDPDNDRLTYSLLYSFDGGKTWQTVVMDLNERYITVNTSRLIGNSVLQSLFRVIVTDGVNTGINDSEQFSIPALAVGH
jgi:hypothetical protein